MSIKSLLTGMAFALSVVTAHPVCADGYQDALAAFDRDNLGLWLNSSLAEKTAKLKDGFAVMVFAELWKDGGAVVECDFFEDRYRLLKADGTAKRLSKAEFTELCSQPALVSYGGHVYLNIPGCESGEGAVTGSVGSLLAGDLYDVMKPLVKALPQRRLKVKFLAKGHPELVLAEGTVSDRLGRDEVRKAVREMLAARKRREWKKEHEAKQKKLPRKPPVVYGSRSTIVKRSDGTFEIPREAPPASRTITWTETVYADGWGESETGERFAMRVPVGEREHTREKRTSQIYNYDELLARMKEYEAAVTQLDNDRPPEVTDAEVEEVLKSGHLRFVPVK